MQGGPDLVGLTTLVCGAGGATVCLPLGLLLPAPRVVPYVLLLVMFKTVRPPEEE